MDTRVVRDMYANFQFGERQGEQIKERNRREKRERKQHREQQLNQHPDILFTIFCEARLHVLLFRPTDDCLWIRILRDQYPGISSQWTFKHAVNRPIRHVMNLSGRQDLLQRFCNDFQQNLIGNDDGEVEALNARITELQLENRTLRRQTQGL